MGVPNVALVSTDLEAAFATAQASSYIDQRAIEGTINLGGLQNQKLADKSVVAYLHDRRADRIGSQFGSAFSLTIDCEGLPAGLGPAVAYVAPQNSMLQVLQSVFGGISGDSGSTIVGAGSTTTTLDITDGHRTRFPPGCLICVGGEVVKVLSVAAATGAEDTITIDRALAAIPTAGTIVYRGVTIYPRAAGFGSDGQSMVWRFLGEQADDQWIARGCCGKVTFESSFDALLSMAVEMQVAQWESISGETLTDADPIGGGPLQPAVGRVWARVAGATTAYEYHADSFKMDPGVNYVPSRWLGGVGTIGRYRQTRHLPTAQFAIPFYEGLDGAGDFLAFWTQSADQDFRGDVITQMGDTPITGGAGTGIVALQMSNAWHSKDPTRDVGGDLMHVGLNLAASADLEPTGGADTALMYAPYRIGVF